MIRATQATKNQSYKFISPYAVQHACKATVDKSWTNPDVLAAAIAKAASSVQQYKHTSCNPEVFTLCC